MYKKAGKIQLNILIKKDLIKQFKSVRTYKFKIRTTPLLLKKFNHIQEIKKRLFQLWLTIFGTKI